MSTTENELAYWRKVQFNNMLLGRLQADCEYYLGFGNRDKKRLWALDEIEQIEKMKELYAWLPEKPEWISMEMIESYENQMVRKNAPSESAEFTA